MAPPDDGPPVMRYSLGEKATQSSRRLRWMYTDTSLTELNLRGVDPRYLTLFRPNIYLPAPEATAFPSISGLSPAPTAPEFSTSQSTGLPFASESTSGRPFAAAPASYPTQQRPYSSFSSSLTCKMNSSWRSRLYSSGFPSHTSLYLHISFGNGQERWLFFASGLSFTSRNLHIEMGLQPLRL